MTSTPESERPSVAARCVRLPAKVADAASLAPVVETRALSRAATERLSVAGADVTEVSSICPIEHHLTKRDACTMTNELIA